MTPIDTTITDWTDYLPHFFYVFFILSQVMFSLLQTDVEEAHPHWGKNSKLVLVSLLLTGLLLAALLVAGYYLKTHRKNSKGVRLVSTSTTVCP